MSRSWGPRAWATRVAVATTTLACLTAAGAVTSIVPASSAPLPATAISDRSAAGPAGTPLTLADKVDLKGYDVAIDAKGTSYIGWISTPVGQTNRAVHLCVLPLGASACRGGVQSTPSFGPSSAAGLQVLAPSGGPVRLVWFHDTPQSVDGPDNAKIATATVSPAGVLSAGASVANAPSFGSLSTAEVGPGGAIWAVVARPSGTGLLVLPGLTSPPVNLSLPFNFFKARLAFRGSTPVLVIDKAGAIAEPLRVAYHNGTSWTPFAKVPRTWNLGGAFDVAAAGGGTHLVATVDNSSYYPQIAAWTGAAFGRFQLTGDKNSCAPRSHDLVTDRSGRLADVSLECTQLAVANHPQRKQAAVVRFPVGGTPAAGEPQIVTTARGHGVVVWSRQSTTGHRLLVVGVRLPALTRKKTGKAKGGKVTITGPVSCMPASTVKVGIKAKRARGWKVASKSLKLDGKAARGRVAGAALKPGSAHKLVGKATFKKAGSRSTASATVKFTACPTG